MLYQRRWTFYANMNPAASAFVEAMGLLGYRADIYRRFQNLCCHMTNAELAFLQGEFDDVYRSRAVPDHVKRHMRLPNGEIRLQGLAWALTNFPVLREAANRELRTRLVNLENVADVEGEIQQLARGYTFVPTTNKSPNAFNRMCYLLWEAPALAGKTQIVAQHCEHMTSDELAFVMKAGDAGEFISYPLLPPEELPDYHIIDDPDALTRARALMRVNYPTWQSCAREELDRRYSPAFQAFIERVQRVGPIDQLGSLLAHMTSEERAFICSSAHSPQTFWLSPCIPAYLRETGDRIGSVYRLYPEGVECNPECGFENVIHNFNMLRPLLDMPPAGVDHHDDAPLELSIPREPRKLYEPIRGYPRQEDQGQVEATARREFMEKTDLLEYELYHIVSTGSFVFMVADQRLWDRTTYRSASRDAELLMNVPVARRDSQGDWQKEDQEPILALMHDGKRKDHFRSAFGMLDNYLHLIGDKLDELSGADGLDGGRSLF